MRWLFFSIVFLLALLRLDARQVQSSCSEDLVSLHAQFDATYEGRKDLVGLQLNRHAKLQEGVALTRAFLEASRADVFGVYLRSQAQAASVRMLDSSMRLHSQYGAVYGLYLEPGARVGVVDADWQLHGGLRAGHELKMGSVYGLYLSEGENVQQAVQGRLLLGGHLGRSFGVYLKQGRVKAAMQLSIEADFSQEVRDLNVYGVLMGAAAGERDAVMLYGAQSANSEPFELLDWSRLSFVLSLQRGRLCALDFRAGSHPASPLGGRIEVSGGNACAISYEGAQRLDFLAGARVLAGGQVAIANPLKGLYLRAEQLGSTQAVQLVGGLDAGARSLAFVSGYWSVSSPWWRASRVILGSADSYPAPKLELRAKGAPLRLEGVKDLVFFCHSTSDFAQLLSAAPSLRLNLSGVERVHVHLTCPAEDLGQGQWQLMHLAGGVDWGQALPELRLYAKGGALLPASAGLRLSADAHGLRLLSAALRSGVSGEWPQSEGALLPPLRDFGMLGLRLQAAQLWGGHAGRVWALNGRQGLAAGLLLESGSLEPASAQASLSSNLSRYDASYGIYVREGASLGVAQGDVHASLAGIYLEPNARMGAWRGAIDSGKYGIYAQRGSDVGTISGTLTLHGKECCACLWGGQAHEKQSVGFLSAATRSSVGFSLDWQSLNLQAMGKDRSTALYLERRLKMPIGGLLLAVTEGGGQACAIEATSSQPIELMAKARLVAVENEYARMPDFEQLVDAPLGCAIRNVHEGIVLDAVQGINVVESFLPKPVEEQNPPAPELAEEQPPAEPVGLVFEAEDATKMAGLIGSLDAGDKELQFRSGAFWCVSDFWQAKVLSLGDASGTTARVGLWRSLKLEGVEELNIHCSSSHQYSALVLAAGQRIDLRRIKRINIILNCSPYGFDSQDIYLISGVLELADELPELNLVLNAGGEAEAQRLVLEFNALGLCLKVGLPHDE